ncbi:MAG: 7-cyano-7-deazaguanine synthase [Rubrobacteraceae bacterium]
MALSATVVVGEVPGDGSFSLRPGVNFVTGEKEFGARFNTPTSLEVDLLTVASAIFAADLAFQRGERSNFQRQIHLTIPVVNRPAFQNVAGAFKTALWRVSNDAWTLNFVQREGMPETSRMWLREGEGKVLLFSGGLDSMSAAILYGEAGERIHLASHVTANQIVRKAQLTAFGYLNDRFPDQFSYHPFRISCMDRTDRGFSFPKDSEREPTQRTRSVLFLTLAALMARRNGVEDVVVIAENGQMAIHLPLTTARIGAFSTHTAHPEFVRMMGELLSILLDYPLNIENPFLYMTKAEVVAGAVERHREVIEGTVSCWKAARVSGDKKHCGYCVPCLSRRVALETHGLELPEYQKDVLREEMSDLDTDNEGKRSLVEMIEFASTFGGSLSQADLESEYPDLLLGEEIDVAAAVDMYRRFARETLDVFGRYPSVKAIMG